MNRRDFARLLAIGGAAPFLTPELAWPNPAPLPPTPAVPGERFWQTVRDQFVMPPSMTVLNAANLCPSPSPVLEVLFESTRSVDRDPSSNNREKTHEGREETRRLIASALRVSPEEILITRNTSESNNFVSSGLDLREGDEVLLHAENHPSNLTAWREKAKRFGFVVKVVDAINPHPGPDVLIDSFRKAITPRTKIVSFTHVTGSVGDLFPARELCALAHERGAMCLVDGAQSYGVLDVDLSAIQPDFYSGSAHKWPCGPKETGVLYVSKAVHSRLAPSVVSLYAGSVGISKTHEGFGQRDEPAIVGFGEALRFQDKIGRAVVEARARELTQALIEGLKTIAGVKVWTDPRAERSAAIVSFLPGPLDVRKLALALYQEHQIVCSTRPGADRGGLRFSPHFYNTHAEIDRALAAVRSYI
jgi:isopenicillin-N epimerase